MFPDPIDEFLDAVDTVDLCIAMAKKYNEPVDDKLRCCSLLITKRIHNIQIRDMFINLGYEKIPAVFWVMMKSQLEVIKAGL